MGNKRQEGRPTLVFGDIHLPYHIDGYLEFLKDIHKQYLCKKEVICMGDIWDNHALSRHDSHPDAVGGITEFDLAYGETQKLAEAFPHLRLCLGNHDAIPERQVATLGISNLYLKSVHDLWNLPKTWIVDEEHIVDNVHYSHGIGCGGHSGALNKVMREQMSAVTGHYHSLGGVSYLATSNNMFFGANAGCLCDPHSLAMAYGKHSRLRPTIGCIIVHNNKRAEFIPMDLDKYKERD